MTTEERTALAETIGARNAVALQEMDMALARKSAELNPSYGWRVKKVHRSPAELAELTERMRQPLSRAERAKRRQDRALLMAAYELDLAAYEPTPLQRQWDIAMACLKIWHEGRKERRRTHG
jgi:hypothetical protein